MTKPKIRQGVPKHLNRARKNPNSLHQRITVAQNNANKGREVKPASLPTPPWAVASPPPAD